VIPQRTILVALAFRQLTYCLGPEPGPVLNHSQDPRRGGGLRTNARESHAKPIPSGNKGCLGSLGPLWVNRNI
jgi:hypothetical protein